MAEEKDAKEEAQPKKPFLKFIILGVIALVLGAGGSAGWNFFIKGKKEEIKKEAHKPYAKKKKEKPGIAYPLDSFIVNLLDKAGRGKRYLKIKIVLEVGDEEGQRTVDSHIPQLKDTILLLLSSQSFSDINTMEGKIELKQILLSRINQVLGEGIVHRLYFTEFVVQ
ncbi:MAG: flagellar basal body protein FliL [Deltaproteobacteria bacterium]|nr:MAG: flagellar basal body protein FliL [Deltaproteobacteria bacterium]